MWHVLSKEGLIVGSEEPDTKSTDAMRHWMRRRTAEGVARVEPACNGADHRHGGYADRRPGSKE